MVVKLLLPRVPEDAKATRESWINAFNDTAEQNNRILKAMSVWKNPRPRQGYRLAHIKGFQRVKIADLKVGETHHAHVLYCRVATTVMIQDAKSVLIEDESGICELAVYHLRKKKIKCGQLIAILDPFYKRRVDGTVRVQVDDPSDLVLEFDPPFALLDGLSRLHMDNVDKTNPEHKVEDEVSLKVHKTVERSTMDFDLEAQRSQPFERSEEKKIEEDGIMPLSYDKDKVSVNYGDLDGDYDEKEEEDSILLVAKTTPIGMPTIREDEGENEEEKLVEDQNPMSVHVKVNQDSSGLDNNSLDAMVMPEFDNAVVGPYDDLATIPVAESSSCEHIPLLVFAVNGLISNQKLLIEAVLGNKKNQK